MDRKLAYKCWQQAQLSAIGDSDATFDSWYEENTKESFDEQSIQVLIDRWRGSNKLLPFRKVSQDIRKILNTALKKYGRKDCMDAIDNYNTILGSDYWMKYQWDIKTFFKQSNAAPEFFNDGVKWVNFSSETKKPIKQRLFSNLSDEVQSEVTHIVHSDILGEYSMLTFKIDRDPTISDQVFESKKNMIINDYRAKDYPSRVIDKLLEKGIILDVFIVNPFTRGISFKKEFDFIVMSDGTREKIRQ